MQDTVTISFSVNKSVALPQPTTAGIPSSRAIIAAWQVRPPRLVTIAAPVSLPAPNRDRSCRLPARHPPVPATFPSRPGPGEPGRCLSSGRWRALTRVLRFALQAIAPQCIHPGARLHCLRPGLQNIEFAIHTILAPLDIHRPLIMPLDHECVTRQLFHLCIGNGKPFAIPLFHIHRFDRMSAPWPSANCILMSLEPRLRRRMAGLPCVNAGL